MNASLTREAQTGYMQILNFTVKVEEQEDIQMSAPLKTCSSYHTWTIWVLATLACLLSIKKIWENISGSLNLAPFAVFIDWQQSHCIQHVFTKTTFCDVFHHS